MKPYGFALVLAAAGAFILAGDSSQAACHCQCVNGQMQPLCDSSIELRPICPPAVCPIMAPGVPPISGPVLPPIGTSSCAPARVCDLYGNCRWQQVCR